MKKIIIAILAIGLCSWANAGPTMSGGGSSASINSSTVLPDGVTGTTQSQANNSTKIATTAYVDTGLGGKLTQSSGLDSAKPGTCTAPSSYYATDTYTVYDCIGTTWTATYKAGSDGTYAFLVTRNTSAMACATGMDCFGSVGGEPAYNVNGAAGGSFLKLLAVASTVITKTEYIPIAYAEDGGTAPSAAAVTASTRKVKTRDFSGSADQDVEIHWIAPLDYYAGVKFRVVGYVTASTAPADTEVVAFSLAGCSNGNSDALGCTAGTAQTSSLTVSGSGYAQYDRLATAYSSAITVTDIAAGESVHLKLIRLATSTDTYAQAFGVAGIEIKYQAKVNASGDY